MTRQQYKAVKVRSQVGKGVITYLISKNVYRYISKKNINKKKHIYLYVKIFIDTFVSKK